VIVYRNPRQAFTLIEAMLAVVLLSIAAAGILLPFAGGAALQAEGINKTLAASLAGDLLDQVVSKPFHDPDGSTFYNPGPESGEAVPGGFDNIDDYNGYTEAQGQLKDSVGNFYTDLNYAFFSRTVLCEYKHQIQQNGLAPECFIKVTVIVYRNGIEAARVVRLVSEP
jgi:prepilin-type N-terminal cleavage/methylation domain-containing protein